MSIFDALAIGGAGLGRGIRQGQAIRREIAEARRRALMEERQQRVQEREADTIAEFRRAQIKDMEDQMISRGLERKGKEQELQRGELDINRLRGEAAETDRLRRYRQTRILPEGQDLDLSFLPGSPDVPGTMEGLLDVQDLLREYLQGQASMYGAAYGGGRGREPTDFEQAIKATLDLIGAPSGYETLPGQIDEAIARRPEFIEQNLARIYEAVKRARRAAPADTTGDAAMIKRYEAFMKQLGEGGR